MCFWMFVSTSAFVVPKTVNTLGENSKAVKISFQTEVLVMAGHV